MSLIILDIVSVSQTSGKADCQRRDSAHAIVLTKTPFVGGLLFKINRCPPLSHAGAGDNVAGDLSNLRALRVVRALRLLRLLKAGSPLRGSFASAHWFDRLLAVVDTGWLVGSRMFPPGISFLMY